MNAKPKRQPTSRGRLLVVGILAVLLVVGLGLVLFLRSVNDLWDTTTINVQGAEAREALETLWGQALPASASDFYYQAAAWQDAVGYGRFTLPAADWDSALDQSTLCFERPLATDGSNAFRNDQLKTTWWQPDAAERQLIGEQCQNAKGVFFHLLVDTTNTAYYIVYLYVYTT
jgi:hypothetical protein